MGKLILVLGGARSGKSAFAQRLALEMGGDDVLFVATAEAGDEEMHTRIEKHRQERPAGWRTLEAARHVGAAIGEQGEPAAVVLVDCLTLLVSNVLMGLGESADLAEAELAVLDEVSGLLSAHRQAGNTFIVVSNEVGLGLVPDNPLGRLYRDVLGRANQILAGHADRVYFLVAGLAMDVRAALAPHGA